MEHHTGRLYIPGGEAQPPHRDTHSAPVTLLQAIPGSLFYWVFMSDNKIQTGHFIVNLQCDGGGATTIIRIMRFDQCRAPLRVDIEGVRKPFKQDDYTGSTFLDL